MSRKNSLTGEVNRVNPSISSDLTTIHAIAKNEAACGIYEGEKVNGAELMRLHAMGLACAEAAMGHSGIEDESVTYLDLNDLKGMHVTTIPEGEAMSPSEFGQSLSSPLNQSRSKSKSNTLHSIAIHEASSNTSIDNDSINAADLMDLHEKGLAIEATCSGKSRSASECSTGRSSFG